MTYKPWMLHALAAATLAIAAFGWIANAHAAEPSALLSIGFAAELALALAWLLRAVFAALRR